MRTFVAVLALTALMACSPDTVRVQVTTARVMEFGDSGRAPISFLPVDLRNVLKSFGEQKTPVPLVFEHFRGPHGGAAAGWVKSCGLEPDGIWCSVVWTQYGRRAACTGAWRYASGGFHGTFHYKEDQTLEDKYFHPTGLNEVSVSNIPLIDGMHIIPIPSCFAWRTPSFP